MNITSRAKKIMGAVCGAMLLSMFAFAAMASQAGASALGAATASYTPPATLIPADVSTDNLEAIFSTIMGNSVVLTLVLVSLAVALFGSVIRIFRKLRSS